MARSFNGSSDHMDIDAAHVVAQGTAFSVAFWIKAAASANDEYIYSESRSTSNNTLFGIHQVGGTGGKLAIFIRNDSGTTRLNNLTSSVAQMDGTWHHFIYTQDASNNVAIYSDGGNKTTGSYTTSGTLTIDRVTVCALRRTTNSNFASASIARLALWNRQLSDSEAALLGAGAQALGFSPVHYWEMDGTASPEPDTGSGTTVNGTLTGTTQDTDFPPTAELGTGIAGSVAAGVEAIEISETGTGIVGADAFGFRGGGIQINVKAGTAIIGTVAAGADAVVLSRSGFADVSGIGSGVVVETGVTSEKTGTGDAAGVGGGVSEPVSPQDVAGRVLIAFDAGPLVAEPAWTRIDGGDAPFPDQFVSGYDVQSGRQTLLSQTDTGTATVYINDHETALFDPRNVSSPFFGKLDGKQIRLQLWDPVAEAWEDQFRGHIDDITWEIDPATGADGKPINASLQIQCVDMFDFLAGYGLTPGLNGVRPPVGGEDGVWYAATDGTVDDRIIEILTDVGIKPSRYLVASGNTKVIAVKYDPDESALQALRDAADAELPFIAVIFCNRHGDFQFRGRYSRFAPDSVAAEPGSQWDFTRWAAGDGEAILAEPDRAQIRVLAYGDNRSDLINAALCYPQNLPAADMPGQVYADTTSINAYGKHAAPPMSDLLTGDYAGHGTITPPTGKRQCFLFAKLLVENQKDPRVNITSLQLKAMAPDDPRAAATWALITKADISHIVNVAVGYPAGTGLAGDSPEDDYYIEGRRLTVRPLNPTHDYVELDLDVSPFEWSADTHGVMPPFSAAGDLPVLDADFTTVLPS